MSTYTHQKFYFEGRAVGASQTSDGGRRSPSASPLGTVLKVSDVSRYYGSFHVVRLISVELNGWHLRPNAQHAHSLAGDSGA